MSQSVAFIGSQVRPHSSRATAPQLTQCMAGFVATAPVPARVASDDGYISVEFDARQWFDDATEKQLQDLCDAGFRLESGARHGLVEFFEPRNHRIRQMLRWCDQVQLTQPDADCGFGAAFGYSGRVDERSARQWLSHRAANQPGKAEHEQACGIEPPEVTHVFERAR